MAKGGRGRPKKVTNGAGNAQETQVPAQSEIGESSQADLNGIVNEMRSEETVKSKNEDEKQEKEKETGTLAHPGPQLRNRGIKLEFVAHMIKNGIPTACLAKSEMEKEARKWRSVVILYVIGECPTITYLANFLEKQCEIKNKPKIFYHNDGYFVVRFETIEESDSVLYGGPHTIANRPVIIKEWGVDFCFEKEILRELPLWIQFPKLPLNCWSGDSLSRIGSVLGKPICADECTSSQTRIFYARLLIEVDVTQPLKYSVHVEGEDGVRIDKKVLYEWVPPFCKKCQKIGHICRDERKPDQRPDMGRKRQWQRKINEPEKDEKVNLNGEEISEKQQGKKPMSATEHGSNQIERTNEKWSIPKRTKPASVIQVGHIRIPTENTYQMITDDSETEEKATGGGDPFPLGLG